MPLWLAPEQVRVLSISEKTNDYAIKVSSILKDAGLISAPDISNEKIGAKIAKAHADKLCYMLVVGPKEAESNTVNVRTRGVKENKNIDVEQFLKSAKQRIVDKTLDLNL